MSRRTLPRQLVFKHGDNRVRRFAFVAAACTLPTLAHAQTSDTVISGRYLIRSVWVDPSQRDGTAEYQFTLTLRSNGTISGQSQGSGRVKRFSSGDFILGRDSESNLQFRVINANTISGIYNSESHRTVMTIRVTGPSTCRLSHSVSLKPGHKYFVAVAQRTGKPEKFRSFQMIGQHCEIR